MIAVLVTYVLLTEGRRAALDTVTSLTLPAAATLWNLVQDLRKDYISSNGTVVDSSRVNFTLCNDVGVPYLMIDRFCLIDFCLSAHFLSASV